MTHYDFLFIITFYFCHFRQDMLKVGLLEVLGNEPNMSLKSRICDIVGELGSFVMEQHEWPEALPFAYHQVLVRI